VREVGAEYRFYMTELSSVGKGGVVEEVWWAAPEVRTVSRQRSRGSVLREECFGRRLLRSVGITESR
jgi:hypothetical protein